MRHKPYPKSVTFAHQCQLVIAFDFRMTLALLKPMRSTHKIYNFIIVHQFLNENNEINHSS